MEIKPWETIGQCYVCGYPEVQHHHIFFGSHRRKFADKYGYIVPLCLRHHTGADGVHQAKNRKYAVEMMKMAQRDWESKYGTRKDFIRECGKSYLED